MVGGNRVVLGTKSATIRGLLTDFPMHGRSGTHSDRISGRLLGYCSVPGR